MMYLNGRMNILYLHRIYARLFKVLVRITGYFLFFILFSTQAASGDNLHFVAKMQAGVAVASGERLGSIVYLGTKQENPARLISFNLITKEVRDFDVPRAKQIWALDQYKGNIILGTRNNKKEAELLFFNVQNKSFEHLINLPIESLIFDIDVLEDDILISTYPNAKVFSYNICTHNTILLHNFYYV